MYIEFNYKELKDNLYRLSIKMPEEGFEEDVKKALADCVNKDAKLRFMGEPKILKKQLLALVHISHTPYSFSSVIIELRLELDRAYQNAFKLFLQK